MKALNLFIVSCLMGVSVIAAPAKKKIIDCSQPVQTALAKAGMAFQGYAERLVFSKAVMEPVVKLNASRERVLVYTLAHIAVDDTEGYLPDSGGEVIVDAKTCQVLRITLDIFSGMP